MNSRGGDGRKSVLPNSQSGHTFLKKSCIPPARLPIAMVRGGRCPGKRSFAGRFGFGNDTARVSAGQFAWSVVACLGADGR